MQELNTINNSGAVIMANEIPVNPWVEIIQQSIAKGVDMASITEFIALQREEEDRQARRAFYAAMSKFQSLMPEISKTGNASFKTKAGNTSYNFDCLNDICNAIRSALETTGLSYSFKMKQEGQSITVQCTISHCLGHSESNTMTALPDSSGSKNAIQQIASTNTYLQRYTLKAGFGISSADDDGQASTKMAADKVSSENFASWKATFNAAIESKETIEELTDYKNQSVTYAAKNEPSFCTAIYTKFEEVKKDKGL